MGGRYRIRERCIKVKAIDFDGGSFTYSTYLLDTSLLNIQNGIPSMTPVSTLGKTQTDRINANIKWPQQDKFNTTQLNIIIEMIVLTVLQYLSRLITQRIPISYLASPWAWQNISRGSRNSSQRVLQSWMRWYL